MPTNLVSAARSRREADGDDPGDACERSDVPGRDPGLDAVAFDRFRHDLCADFPKIGQDGLFPPAVPDGKIESAGVVDPRERAGKVAWVVPLKPQNFDLLGKNQNRRREVKVSRAGRWL
jgi:hypothetical protein